MSIELKRYVILDRFSKDIKVFKEKSRGKIENRDKVFYFMFHCCDGGIRKSLRVNTCQAEQSKAELVKDYFIYRCKENENYLFDYLVRHKRKMRTYFFVEQGNVKEVVNKNTEEKNMLLRIDEILAIPHVETFINERLNAAGNDSEKATNSDYSISMYVYEAPEKQFGEMLEATQNIGTKSTYQTCFKKHLIPYFKGLNPQLHIYELTRQMILDYYTAEITVAEDTSGVGQLLNDSSYKPISQSTLKKLSIF